MFGVPDRAGALFAALEPLQTAGISMSKIESRPSKRKPWEYVFFVDVEGHRQDDALVRAMRALETNAASSKCWAAIQICQARSNPLETSTGQGLFLELKGIGLTGESAGAGWRS